MNDFAKEIIEGIWFLYNLLLNLLVGITRTNQNIEIKMDEES